MKSKVKFSLILGLIILSLAVYGYFKSVPGVDNQATSRPQIEINPLSFDFGDIVYGQVVEQAFKVRNTGSEILEIKRLATSCGCTSAKIAKEQINPGEEAELRVTYDTGAMSGPHGKGRQERIVYIKSSDPVNPQIEIMIYADVK